MFSNQGARMSVDSFSTLSSNPRSEVPLHRHGSVTSHSYPTNRRDSTASSVHSIGGHLDTSSVWEGVFEASQNAISTLLQPPIVRTGLLPHTSAPASSAHKPPTAKDIPPVTLTNITRIDAAEFKPYLSQVGALYEQLRRVKESEDEGTEQLLRRNEGTDEGHLRPGGRPGASTRRPSTASMSSTMEAPTIRRRSSSGYGRSRATQGPPPLNTIPNVYFDDDFHLENPRTFDIVSERSEVVRPAPGSTEEKNAANGSAGVPRKALATNAILQEKLSWYMDTVEMHLINSISTASTTFFTALGSLRELHSEAADSVDRIKVLRKELSALNEEIATTGLDIVLKRRRRENLQQLNNAVQQMAEIVEGLAKCEAQVEAGDVAGALNDIEGLENLISGRKSIGFSNRPLVDLRDAVALQGVNEDITTLRLRVGKGFETKFLAVLLGDLRRHVDTVSTQEVLLRWSSAAKRVRGGHWGDSSALPAYLAATEDLRSELMPILGGLHQAKHITNAIAAYREIVLKEIRNLIRRPLPSSNDDDNESMMSTSTVGGARLTQQEKSSILARNLRALDPADAEEMFTKTYISVTETLRRLTTQVRVLFDAASSMGQQPDPSAGLRSPPPLKSPPLNSANREIQEDIHLTMDMANLLGQAVDVSQDKIVKVLKVRSEQSSHLPLVWFLRYFTLNLYFANECETISGRGGTALKTVVNGHIRDFIQSHADVEKQKLAQGMDSDTWSAKDFSEKDSLLLGSILESSTKDAPAWSEGSQIWKPYSEEEESSSALNNNNNGRPRAESNGTATTKEKTRSAVIDAETFTLPQSAILCLEGLARFLHLMAGIPSLAADVASSLVSYLQLFNSRCKQLILGAGATRSAGLKNITTKHLALSSQALAFVSTLIPHVREFVRRYAAAGPGGVGGGGGGNSGGSGGGGGVGGGGGASALMLEFDKVRRDIQDHQQSIYDKLVEIMSGRASAHTKSMRELDWDREVDGGGDDGGEDVGVDRFMEVLVKETVTLHKVLTRHLPEGVIQLIMMPVFDSYKSQLGKALEAVEPKTGRGVKRLQADIDYLNARLAKIESSFAPTGEYLSGIVNAKKVAAEKEKEKSPSPPSEKASSSPADTAAAAETEAGATAGAGESNGNGNGNGEANKDNK